MKKVVLFIFTTFVFTFSAQAADVVCACDAEAKCSDVKIKFVPASPGVYMTVEYAYGERNLEGFATVVTDSKEGRTIYRLGNFTLVDTKGTYSLPGRPASCE